nr:hypothetical protein Iba_chr05cCG3180 [Ipomoea batatas]GMC96906.1 hypothetical protein Iba_chr05dCG2000 [Ipomoea batatas]
MTAFLEFHIVCEISGLSEIHTVLQLKNQVQDRYGIQVHNQTMIYGGRVLRDEEFLLESRLLSQGSSASRVHVYLPETAVPVMGEPVSTNLIHLTYERSPASLRLFYGEMELTVPEYRLVDDYRAQVRGGVIELTYLSDDE